MPSLHSDSEYERELEQLRANMSAMAASVTDMLEQSMTALVRRDSELARETIEFDHEVNLLEVETDELCLRMLARRQPVASDLRFITVGLKAVTDLERIGDLCVNICERAIELNTEEALSSYGDLLEMSLVTQAMIRDSMSALTASDAALAQSVLGRDRTVDALYAELFRDALTHMLQDPKAINRATRIQAIAKYLERIGDHATNLAEMAVFFVKGKDVRHPARLRAPGQPPPPRGVLFVCVRNSARSQMAEGWAKELLPPDVRVWSAGSQPSAAVHPEAIRAMQEVGVDITQQRPKRISDVPLGEIDSIVTLCAEEVCIALPGSTRRETWLFEDPAHAVERGEDEPQAFRRVRDHLRLRLAEFSRRNDLRSNSS